MGKYYEGLNPIIKKYFKILSYEFPEWLEEYIDTKEMLRIGKISMSCGTDYSKCFNLKFFYSNLDHSVAVALIIWNFTHDKKQALSGLFHDIATPVFKHCIDFMNGDSKNQESTEEKTVEMIKNSNKIMSLLKRDNILLEEVCDYKIYPIADNNLPKLSADRLEYNFSSGLSFYEVWNLEDIKEVYDDLVVSKNEDNIDELAFSNINICEKYIETLKELWPQWVCGTDRIVMQFLADMCKSMNKKGLLTIDDLYNLSEREVISLFENCSDTYLRNAWNDFKVQDKSYIGYDNYKYSINVESKARYLNPLVKTNNGVDRISNISTKSNEYIKEYLKFPKSGYVHFDFDFKPY